MSRMDAGIQGITKQMAAVNVLVSPWALLSWNSIEDDLERAVEAVVEESYVQNILWEIKGGLTLGIFAFFAFLSGSLGNLIFSITGILAAISIMAVPALRSDSRKLPDKIRKVALVRHMVEALEGSELFHLVVMGKSGEMDDSRDAPSDYTSPQDTLTEWKRQICAGCKKLEQTITGGNWGQFDVQLLWTLRKLGAVVESPTAIDHARAVVANTWTRVFVERFFGSTDYTYRTLFEDFVTNVIHAYESAYDYNLEKPLAEVLYLSENIDDTETFLSNIPLDLIWSGTFWEIVYLQQKVPMAAKADITNQLVRWWDASFVPIDFLKDIYNEINTGTHQLGMDKKAPTPEEDTPEVDPFRQAVYAVLVNRWDEISPNIQEIRTSIVEPLVGLIHYEPPVAPNEWRLDFSKDQLERVLLQILNECPWYHPREQILKEHVAICNANMKTIVEYIFNTNVPSTDSRYSSLMDLTKSSVIGLYGSAEAAVRQFGFELQPEEEPMES
jgi:hypothetical protein